MYDGTKLLCYKRFLSSNILYELKCCLMNELQWHEEHGLSKNGSLIPKN